MTKWIAHSIHHTVKHLSAMIKEYKKGKSFEKSHELTKNIGK